MIVILHLATANWWNEPPRLRFHLLSPTSTRLTLLLPASQQPPRPRKSRRLDRKDDDNGMNPEYYFRLCRDHGSTGLAV